MSTEKFSAQETAELFLETALETMESAIVTDNTRSALTEQAEFNEAEESLRDAIASAMAKKGLASVMPSAAMVEATGKVAGWREALLDRFMALCKCHKRGASYVVKSNDLDLSAEQIRVRDKRTKQVTIVPAQREKAMSQFIGQLLKGCYDSTTKDKWGSITIIPALDPVRFTIESPSERSPIIRMHFLD